MTHKTHATVADDNGEHCTGDCTRAYPTNKECPICAAKDAKIAELEARVRSLTEWQPMETAPKDGTPIRVYYPNGIEGVYELIVRMSTQNTWRVVGSCHYYLPEANDFIGWLPLPEVKHD